MKTVFVNPERCIGCLQCELACAVEHSASQDESPAFLEAPVPRKRVHVEAGSDARPWRSRTGAGTATRPRACRSARPARSPATTSSALVLVEAEAVHRMCDVRRGLPVRRAHLPPAGRRARAPRSRSPSSATAAWSGCSRGEEPACVEVCKVDALVFGDLNELVAAGQAARGRRRPRRGRRRRRPPLPGGDPLAGWRAVGRGRAWPRRRAASAAGPARGTTGNGQPARQPGRTATNEGGQP